MDNKKLLNKARTAMQNGYAPYSNFLVGAAVLSDNGEVYTGCNVENASYGLSICAERVALFNAVSTGATKISKIAIVASSGEGVTPCGACRQVITEFAPKCEIIIENAKGEPLELKIDELLPHAFGPKSLG